MLIMHYCLGWSKQELLSNIPDGKGGYLPAIRQSPIGTASPVAVGNNNPPPLNKSISGTRVAPAPFVLQSQTPSSPFLSRPTSHSSVSYSTILYTFITLLLLQLSRPFTGAAQVK